MTDSVFRIKSADILIEGERWDPGETIDLSRIASLVHFSKPVKNPSGQVDYLSFLWDNDAYVDDNTLTVNMTRLKGKLEQIGIVNAVTTRRGMGYILN